MVALVDYNMGNLASVKNAFKKLGSECELVSDPDKLHRYDRVLLPGVGAFGDAMEHLSANAMDSAIKEYVKSGRYVLGICLGMQVLFDRGYEFGTRDGLGLIEGEVVPFDKTRFQSKLKVPHMGWNRMVTAQKHQIFSGLEDETYLYFVHSYHVQTAKKYVIGTSHYGYDFVSAVAKDNVIGLQPHPEKSHKNGLQILQNFINL